MSKQAKEVWVEIVSVRPVDFFQPGSLHLLEAFCCHVIRLRHVQHQLEDADPQDRREYAHWVDMSTKLSGALAQLAQKLRLSIQSALRTESRKLDEKEPKINELIGGLSMAGRTKTDLN